MPTGPGVRSWRRCQGRSFYSRRTRCKVCRSTLSFSENRREGRGTAPSASDVGKAARRSRNSSEVGCPDRRRRGLASAPPDLTRSNAFHRSVPGHPWPAGLLLPAPRRLTARAVRLRSCGVPSPALDASLHAPPDSNAGAGTLSPMGRAEAPADRPTPDPAPAPRGPPPLRPASLPATAPTAPEKGQRPNISRLAPRASLGRASRD